MTNAVQINKEIAALKARLVIVNSEIATEAWYVENRTFYTNEYLNNFEAEKKEILRSISRKETRLMFA